MIRQKPRDSRGFSFLVSEVSAIIGSDVTNCDTVDQGHREGVVGTDVVQSPVQACHHVVSRAFRVVVGDSPDDRRSTIDGCLVAVHCTELVLICQCRQSNRTCGHDKRDRFQHNKYPFLVHCI